MPDKKTYEFIVVKKTYSYKTCSACLGTGKKIRTFRKMTFVENCPSCNGEGRKRFEQTEEYPLKDAIRELQSITSR